MITNLAKKKKRGFTLVEVIIVLAIIAIIAAIAIPNLTKVRTESKVKADIQSAETIRRTMITLITEDKIKVQSTTVPLYLKFDGNGKATVLATDLVTTDTDKGNGNTALANNNPIMATGVLASDVSEYFKGIKVPQVDKATNYMIQIVGTDAKAQIFNTSDKITKEGVDKSGNIIVTVIDNLGNPIYKLDSSKTNIDWLVTAK